MAKTLTEQWEAIRAEAQRQDADSDLSDYVEDWNAWGTVCTIKFKKSADCFDGAWVTVEAQK